MTQEFFVSRLRFLLLLVPLLSLTSLALATLTMTTHVGAITCTLFFAILLGWLSARCVRQLFRVKPLMTIGPNGIYHADLMAQPVPWSAITSIYLNMNQFLGQIDLWVDRLEPYERPGFPNYKWLNAMRRDSSPRFKRFRIGSAPLRATTGELLTAAARWGHPAALYALAEHLHRSGELPEGAPTLSDLVARIERAARTMDDRLGLADAMFGGRLPRDRAHAERLMDGEIARDAVSVKRHLKKAAGFGFLTATPFLDALRGRLVAAGHDVPGVEPADDEELRRVEDYIEHGAWPTPVWRRVRIGCKAAGCLFMLLLGPFVMLENLDGYSAKTGAIEQWAVLGFSIFIYIAVGFYVARGFRIAFGFLRA